jgi:regulator of protease activity HflC (stomatin/prohibitin superfamily)
MGDLLDIVISSSKDAAKCAATPGVLIMQPSRGIMPYIVVPEGFYALVTTNGAEIEWTGPTGRSIVWPSGFYSCAPWTKISHLVTKGDVNFDTPCKGCTTKDNVSVQINVCITFRVMGQASRGEDPRLVHKFVHEVGARGLQQQLRDAIDEAVRGLARSMKHHEVYGLRSITIMTDGTVVNAEPEDGRGFDKAMNSTTSG